MAMITPNKDGVSGVEEDFVVEVLFALRLTFGQTWVAFTIKEVEIQTCGNPSLTVAVITPVTIIRVSPSPKVDSAYRIGQQFALCNQGHP